MSFSKAYSAQTNLLKGQLITVEVDLSKGLNAFSIVGLPDKAVEESKDRVGSALKNSGYESPKHKNQKTVVSLSPANIKKEGSYFDVAIALAYLLSTEELKFDPERKLFLGELSLNGELREIKGTLALAQEAKRLGFEELYVPIQNAKEAALIDGIKIYGVETLGELIEHLRPARVATRNSLIENTEKFSLTAQQKTAIDYQGKTFETDFSDIKGQETAKRGLEIAAAGGHNIAMYGPPGTGKTMLARAFAGILPSLPLTEVLEVTSIHSVAGTLFDDLITHPPFRAPHHSASYVSMIGGGTFPKPGEVTLAHRGVLFLDEFPEFEKRVIESLRQPLEDNIVSISRARGTAIFPSNFILVASMNPCPCGNSGSKQKACICRPTDLARYQRKLSGPIMDRIDMWVNVGNVDFQKLSDESITSESSLAIKKRVWEARKTQFDRFKKHKIGSGRQLRSNSDMNVKDLSILAPLDQETKKALEDSAVKLNLSARSYHRVIKLARTIADLAGSPQIERTHLMEALQYRPKSMF